MATKKKGKEKEISLSLNARWFKGVDHSPQSRALYNSLVKIDQEEKSNFSIFQSCREQELLKYLFDIHFEQVNAKKETPTEEAV